jgi:hypothetical protein
VLLEAEDVLEEVAIGLGVIGVDDYVGAGDHAKQCRGTSKDWEEGVVVGWEAWMGGNVILGV